MLVVFTLGAAFSTSFEGVTVFFLAGNGAAATAGGRPGFFFEAVAAFAFAILSNPVLRPNVGHKQQNRWLVQTPLRPVR